MGTQKRAAISASGVSQGPQAGVGRGPPTSARLRIPFRSCGPKANRPNWIFNVAKTLMILSRVFN